MRDMPGAAAVPATPRPGPAIRVAAVAVLLAVTVIGLRTRGAFASKPDAVAAGATGAVLATALIACEGVALAAFIVLLVAARAQGRPTKQDEPERLVIPWWAKTIAVLLALALLATPPVVLLTRPARKHAFVPPLGHLVNPVSGSQPTGAAASSSAWPLIAGMVIAIAVVLTLTLVLRRWRRPGPPLRLDRLAVLAESLAAGSAALRANADPRTAIIACYAAMEQGFTAVGSAPAAADTPAEVLTRAITAGIFGSQPRPGSGPETGAAGEAAELLTGLFRRARYSSDPMTPADSRGAATALAQLRTALDVAQVRAQDDTPPGAHPDGRRARAGAGR